MGLILVRVWFLKEEKGGTKNLMKTVPSPNSPSIILPCTLPSFTPPFHIPQREKDLEGKKRKKKSVSSFLWLSTSLLP